MSVTPRLAPGWVIRHHALWMIGVAPEVQWVRLEGASNPS